MADYSFIDSPWVGLGVGLSVGAGIMIILLAKWGAKLFGIKDPIKVSAQECPYSKDHPLFNKFMSDSLSDRKQMRDALSEVGNNVARMEGKLDILLQGARVRWNSGLIPPDKDGGR